MAAPALDLDAIRACLEGAIPVVMCTCDPAGTPNVTYVSQAEYVDARHLALSFQFFNKTRRNVLANPVAELLVAHPSSGAMYRLTARYLRTETEGALFERMKAKLAGIASHTGMSEVFRLRGEGLSLKEIADRLNVSVKTVGSYDARIKEKLGLNNVGELVREAVLWNDRRKGL